MYPHSYRALWMVTLLLSLVCMGGRIHSHRSEQAVPQGSVRVYKYTSWIRSEGRREDIASTQTQGHNIQSPETTQHMKKTWWWTAGVQWKAPQTQVWYSIIHMYTHTHAAHGFCRWMLMCVTAGASGSLYIIAQLICFPNKRASEERADASYGCQTAVCHRWAYHQYAGHE